MGLFNIVYFKCSECGTKMERQAKEGNRWLEEFVSDKIPFNIAQELNYQPITCEKCCTTYQIQFDLPEIEPRYVARLVKDVN